MTGKKIILVAILSVAGIVAAKPGFAGEPEPLRLDSDGDGLCNRCEDDIFHTDPYKGDTDDDGIPDGLEDHDGDGISNRDEIEKTIELIDGVERGITKVVMALQHYWSFMPLAAYRGMTPLILAAEKGHFETLKALLKAGVDPNEQGRIRPGDCCNDAVSWNGRTALMYLASYGNAEAVGMLINAGADVNSRDEKGWTALMSAVKSGNVQTVQVLLDAGVDVNAETDNGSTALKTARHERQTQIAELLKIAGANR